MAAGNLQADATQPAATGGETAKPAEAAQGPATEPPASAAPADPKPAPPAASAAQQAPAATVARAGESTLRLTFRGTAWVEILDASGQSLVSRNHPAGSTGEVYGKPPFRVTIGNAPEVRLSYNGREVDLAPHTKANVARLTLP